MGTNDSHAASVTASELSEEVVTNEIKAFLLERFPAFQGAPLTADTPLLEDGDIDSLGMIELVGFLEERFGVEMGDEDFEPEKMGSLSALYQLVKLKRAG